MIKYTLVAIFFFILTLNTVYARDLLIVGTVENENNVYYEDIAINIKDISSGFYLCGAKNDYTGSIRINCNLEDNTNYLIEVLQGDKVFNTSEFKTLEKDILTIGKNGYNDILLGFYSKDITLSLFSERYKELEDELFMLQYLDTPGEEHDHSEDGFMLKNESYISFQCKDPYKRASFIHYYYYRNGAILEEGLTDIIIIPEIKIGDTLTYIDGSNKKNILLTSTLKEILVPIDNCSEENSEKQQPLITTSNEKYSEEELEEIAKKSGSGSIVISEKEIIIKPIEEADKLKEDIIYRETYIEPIIEKKEESKIMYILYMITVTILLVILFILYKKRKKK